MTRSLPAEDLQKIMAATALGRMVNPEEIANAVVVLAMEFLSVTGQVFVIDGGRFFH
jgi:NAD(P)-dependent dehydrogenase (short-subunit alcohol dehydrogenase family)